jgi:SRSO17 transposase
MPHDLAFLPDICCWPVAVRPFFTVLVLPHVLHAMGTSRRCNAFTVSVVLLPRPWTYSFAKRRKVYGLHTIVVLWCSHDWQWRIPVGFRLWRPKRSCAPQRYQTKPNLALTLLHEVNAAHVPFDYIAFDTNYTTGKMTRALTRMGA